jgi:hypothetical protein
MPSGPLRQVPMDQLPSTPPQVSYQAGLLIIVAQNSSLGDILREVSKLTGAEIEVPPNASERVATRLGPGPAREVLASLLNGSGFNYVMVGSVADPNTVASVVLMSKPAGASGATAANTYQPPPQYAPPERVQMAPGTGPGGPVVQQPAADADADGEDKDDEDTADEDQAQGQADGSGAAAPDGTQPNGGPKSPEEILQMLRQRQTQQGQPGQVQPAPQIPRPNQQPPDNQ